MHRQVLAGGHGEGPGHQAGQPGEADERPAGMGPGHPEDERDVGDQAVADPEDGGPQAAGVEVAMVVVEGVPAGGGHDQRS